MGTNRAIRVGTDQMTLTFHNATLDETGEYVCYINDRKHDIQTRSIYIHVGKSKNLKLCTDKHLLSFITLCILLQCLWRHLPPLSP